jgi:hypothetical protein
MKRLLRVVLYSFSLFLLIITGQVAQCQIAYTWNGSVSTDWSTPGNWTPNGVPGTADNVTIVTGGHICQLSAGAGITNFKLTSGLLDLGGNTLTIDGATAAYSTGTVQNGNMTVTAATSTVFGGGPVVMNCVVNVTSAGVTMKNTTFQKALTITKTGTSNDASTGGNVFNDVTVMSNPGSGYFMLGNGSPDQFNAPVTFNNTGSATFYVAYNSLNNIFNAAVTLNNAPSANTAIQVTSNNSTTAFNDNIVMTSAGGSGIQFGGGATSSSTLAAGKTVSIGAGGWTSGTLLLHQFTQTGATAQQLTLGGTGTLILGPAASFDGDVTAVTPALALNGCTFNGAANLTKNGPTGDWSSGGNVFNGPCSITNNGASYLVLGNSNPDIWNNDVTFTDNGQERLLPCWASTGNQFNGNIYVNTSGSAQGIQFCGGNSTATATLAATKTIMAGSGGLTAGFLYLKQFTQAGNAPVNITATGTSSLYLGPNSNFGGAFAATAPDIWVQGATYNSPAAFTKTGGSSNHNNQNQNIFNSTCTIDQQSSTGYFMLGYNSNDLFNDNIIVTASAQGGIYLGWTSGTGTPTLAAGKTILVGASGFNAGFLYLNTFTQLGNAPMALNLTGGTTGLYFARNSVIGGDLTFNTPDVYFNGATFNGLVSATKTGASNDYSNGGNIFQANTTINATGAGYMVLGNGTPDTWNSDVSFNSSGSTFIMPAWNSPGNMFNGNITVTSTNASTGVRFCQTATATATLAAGKTIQTGSAGFSSGSLQIQQFTQLGSAPVNLTLTGATTLLQAGPSFTAGGDITVVSPRILLNGGVYAGLVNLTKTGATGEWSTGGNTFNSTVTINQQGAGYFGFANALPDVYNGDLYTNNNSTERIIFANNSTGNQFNGNIILTQVGTSVGTAFGWGAPSSLTLAAGKTMSIGAAGYTVGYLQLQRFTQLGNAPVNLPMTGTGALSFGPSSAIGGDLLSTSGALYFNGCVFSGMVNSTKTGPSGDGSSGNNVFNGAATITEAGGGYLLFGNGNHDQFNSTATFNNTGSGSLYVAYNSTGNVFGGVTTFNNASTGNTFIYVSPNSAGTVFNDNIVVSSLSGQGVQFCTGNSSASATLAAGKTISVGPGGFSAGTLNLRQFIQTGATPQQLTLTGTGNLTFGPSSSFGGDVNCVSPALYFNGCNFGGAVTALKNGATSDNSAGNNVFNGIFSATNTGAGYFLMGYVNPDLWQSTATFINNSPAQSMYVAHNSTGNIFNGDVLFNNQPGGNGLWIYSDSYGTNTQFNGNIYVTNAGSGGVSFGANSGTSILADGKTISVGAAGFGSGGLVLKSFTQTGLSTAQNIVTTGSSYIQYSANSSFDGAVTSSSPGLLFNGTTFNGVVNSTKTGSTNDQSQGNNVFNAAATFINNGTGYLMMTNNFPDLYKKDVVFVQNNTGVIYPNYNNNSSYAGGVTVTSPAAAAITFGAGSTGVATFTGSAVQNINATGGTPVPVFTRLAIANTGGGVTLNTTSVNVSKTLTLTAGLFNTTMTRILTMLNGSLTASGDALSVSYVNGPMRYQKSSSGASIMNFPIGNGPDCRPVVLSVNHTSGTLYTYTAQLFDIGANSLSYSFPPSIDAVSFVHYYTIARADAAGNNQPNAGLSGNQTIQIYFGSNDVVSNGATLTIVKSIYTAPNSWIDIGGVGGPTYSAGTSLTGSIISTSAPYVFNSFSNFALANRIGGGNVLPVGMLYFHAQPDNGGVGLTWATTSEANNSYFTVEKSRDGTSFESVQRVSTAAPDGNSSVQLNYTGYDANPYSGVSYYRLRQTDLDGHDNYSAVEAVNFAKRSTLAVYPNPTKGSVYISGIDAASSAVAVSWYDAGGKLVSQEMIAVQNGIAVSNPRFANGIYLLKIVTADGNVHFQHVLVLK